MLTGWSIDRLVADPPDAVVHWRAERAQQPTGQGADRGDDVVIDVLDDTGRTVEHLIQVKAYRPRQYGPAPLLQSLTDAPRLAAWARHAAKTGSGPLLALQSACESLGLLAFIVELETSAAAGASARIGELTGVCWVQATSDPGRRYFTMAHELGRHLAGDPASRRSNAVRCSRSPRMARSTATTSTQTARLLAGSSGSSSMSSQANGPRQPARRPRALLRAAAAWSRESLRGRLGPQFVGKLADLTKVGLAMMAQTVAPEGIDCIVTDAQADEIELGQLRVLGPQVVIAGGDGSPSRSDRPIGVLPA